MKLVSPQASPALDPVQSPDGNVAAAEEQQEGEDRGVCDAREMVPVLGGSQTPNLSTYTR